MKIVIVLLLTISHLDMLKASSAVLARQKRNWIIESFSIEEGNKRSIPYVIGKIVLERNYTVRFTLTGQGINKPPINSLEINQDNGEIMLIKEIDYETYTKLELVFTALNPNQAVDTQLGVHISILDINDNAPVFQLNLYNFTVKESMKQGDILAVIHAMDRDMPNSVNSTVNYKIVSVNPKTSNVDFEIDQIGRIKFKGCLDYEETSLYKIIVEAKDRGDKVQLSSSTTVVLNIEDANDNLPVLVSPMATGKVKERETNVTVLTIKVTDKDKPSTPAWKVRYYIEDDKDGHFQIDIDEKTNDGILKVIKPLDFESGILWNLSISVKNEEDYFSCIVKNKKPRGLWDVEIIHLDRNKGKSSISVNQRVVITVEDVNDPPEFKKGTEKVYVKENVKIGHFLQNVTATDMDSGLLSVITYKVAEDPAGWVTVNSKTGAVTTKGIVDRESKYVVNNTYTVVIHAVDNGKPPMTGTVLLKIYVNDENDNTPTLISNMIDICMADGESMNNITAEDIDEGYNSGPFRFELLNAKELKGKWRLDPTYGETVNLIRGSKVFSGVYELSVKVYDRQDYWALHNLTVTVCKCTSLPPNCRHRMSTAAQIGGGALGIMFVAMFLLLGLVLLASVLSCRHIKQSAQIDDDGGNTLLVFNTETPGSDCTVPHNAQLINATKVGSQFSYAGKNGILPPSRYDKVDMGYQNSSACSSFHHGSARSSFRHAYGNTGINPGQYSNFHSTTTSVKNHNWRAQSELFSQREALHSLLEKRLFTIQGNKTEHQDYDPHVYAYEVDSITDADLDAISITDIEFVPDQMLHVGPQFTQLATICMSSMNKH
ncbi:cadherin-like protein 26 [Amia ocellicauda]|uniref:cadherin-like protein 26 n=1 Tax=Amia ocellicauda TaxID=2972642 RepID=UPI003464A77D